MFLNKNKKQNIFNRGMTYVELIVVMSIFAIMLAITMFNYNKFQALVDIKNLSNDVALKVVQAQKYSVNGLLPPLTQQSIIGNVDVWTPSYGVYFQANSPRFIYFTDIDKSHTCDATCLNQSNNGEFLEAFNITKGNKISSITTSACSSGTLTDFTVVFIRPSSEAKFSASPALASNCDPKYASIIVSSPDGLVTSTIKVYTSGRIEIK